MLNKFFEKIDQLIFSIPYKIRKIITFFLAGLWFILAVLVAFISFQQGRKAAPVVGEDLYLSEFKEKLERNKNLKKSSNLVLPDLNDLVKEEAPLKIESLNSQSEKIDSIQLNKNPSKNVVIEPIEEKTIFHGENGIDRIKDDEMLEVKPKNKTKLDLLPIEN